MPTKIYSVNLIVNDQYKIEGWPLKCLPIHILFRCEYLLEFIYQQLTPRGIKRKSIKKNPKTGYPDVEIEYLKFISNVNKETYPD